MSSVHHPSSLELLKASASLTRHHSTAIERAIMRNDRSVRGAAASLLEGLIKDLLQTARALRTGGGDRRTFGNRRFGGHHMAQQLVKEQDPQHEAKVAEESKDGETKKRAQDEVVEVELKGEGLVDEKGVDKEEKEEEEKQSVTPPVPVQDQPAAKKPKYLDSRPSLLARLVFSDATLMKEVLTCVATPGDLMRAGCVNRKWRDMCAREDLCRLAIFGALELKGEQERKALDEEVRQTGGGYRQHLKEYIQSMMEVVG